MSTKDGRYMLAAEREPLRDYVVAVAKHQADQVRAELTPLVDLEKEMYAPIARGNTSVTSAAVQALVEQVRTIRRELEELRGQVANPWKGVWSPTADYERGNFATHGGQLWYCREGGTKEKPGTGDDWSMMTKAAR